MKNIYAILPCYNEEKNIGSLIEEWNSEKEKLQKEDYNLKIIAINDCSTDNTRDVILEKKSKYNNVDIIEHEQNKGLRGGLNTAINYFHTHAKTEDLLVLMDGDNTHSPKYIHEMLEKINEGNNCVIASRYEKGANIVGLAENRKLMSNFAKVYYTAVLHIPNVKDYTCGYRVYTYEIINNLIEKCGENAIKEKSFACMMELLYKVYLVGGKFAEVAFELRYDNKKGESKMKVFNTASRSIVTALKLKYDIYSIICFLFLTLFTIFLSLQNNYSPIRSTDFLGHDCGIFSYIAFAMQKGKVLYLEAWENKGPLLYFIYYIGLSINERYGIYILETIGIFISVLFSYKTIKVITNKRIYSIIGVVYAFSAWHFVNEGGSFSENFALPLICVGLYITTKYILTGNRLSNFQIVILGILTGLISLLRLNMLAIFAAMFITIGVILIWKKEFKEIARWLICGIIGFVIAITPSIIYLVKNGALMSCLNTAYFDILSGFNAGSILDRLEALKNMLAIMNPTGVITVTILFFAIMAIINLIGKLRKDGKYIYIYIYIFAGFY